MSDRIINDLFIDEQPGKLYAPTILTGLEDTAAVSKLQNDISAEVTRATGEEARIEALFTTPTQEAVDNWLDEHPEATTTVQDGAITLAKLHPDVRADVEEITELKEDLAEIAHDRIPMSYMVGWTIGEFNYSTGTINTSIKTRVSSTDDFVASENVNIHIADGYSLYVSKKENGSYTQGSWRTGDIIIDSGTYRFIIRNDSMPSSVDLNVLVQAITTDSTVVYLTERVDKLDASVVDELYGHDSVAITPVFVDGLNFADDATKYNSNSGYDTYYTEVKKGESYSWKFTKPSGVRSPYIRMSFSLVPPSSNVAGTQLLRSTLVNPSYTYIYSADSDGYLCMSAYNDNMPAASQSLVNAKREGIVEKVSDLQDETKETIETIQNGKRRLYYAEESLSQDGTDVILNQWTVVPYNHAKLYISTTNDICVSFNMMVSAYDNTTSLTEYYGNGDIVYLPEDHDLYKIRFAYCSEVDGAYSPTGDTLTIDTLLSLINDGKVSITYDDDSVIVNNKDIEKRLWAMLGSGNMVLTHISDTHGDAVRYGNFLAMSKHINADVAIHSGDAVNVSPSDGYSYLNQGIVDYPDMPTAFCIGNHDAYSTDAANYTNFIKMFEDAYNYTLDDTNTYYYMDFPDKKIRIIVTNIYEERHIGYSCRLSSAQIDWLISTLASTPAEYGVFIVAHCSENFVPMSQDYDKFYSSGMVNDWTNKYDNITGHPVSDIVDAFIAKSTVAGSFTEIVKQSVSSSDTTIETVSYSADFTGVPSSVEFIAYINGHKHKDMIGYFSDTVHPQLTLNITNGVTAHYYADQSDFPRGDGKGSVQDAFNVYAIDRTTKCVNVIRIGSNVKYNLSMRDFMTIPYAAMN